MTYPYYQGELESADINLRSAERDLDDARLELYGFELNVRINDPTYSRVWEAKNDTQRKLILEKDYLVAEAEEGKKDWWELKQKVDKCGRELRERQREYDYYKDLSIRFTVAMGK